MKNKVSLLPLLIASCIFLCILSCDNRKQQLLFTELAPTQSGISFNNQIVENDSSFSFINEFGYMGGGVGIGDFNNDGKKDIFFTANQASSRLYLNRGDNSFEDITSQAGIGTNVWCTGVSVVDINDDGYDDIYVCVFGKDLKHRSKNLLFINQHDLTFKEQAAAYGLADLGFSTQAAFLDYDKDGDLDMYLVNYLLSDRNSNTVFPKDRSGYSPANDVLYRNDGDSSGVGHPIFSNVSIAAGIKEDGYGLGLSVSDFNNDGWPDIYVTNDFVSNDELWLNNHDGSFSNQISAALQHQSYSSMGVDAADLNNDALNDIVTLDMMPETNERRKLSFSFLNNERYELERKMGYEPEFMRNMLQLNNGVTNSTSATPFFSEIGRLSGIYATDWSWSVLLADFDNDGWKDIHITNGIGRDFINADFLEFSSTIFNSSSSKEAQQKSIQEKLVSMPTVKLQNYLYRNNRDLTFSNIADSSGMDEHSISNGAAYADLDNDGDLDLVINNINQPASVFINNTIQSTMASNAHYMKFNLEGPVGNRNGFGTKIFIYQKDKVQTQEQYPVRGYFSSVDQQLLFGLGSQKLIDSIVLQWSDGKEQDLYNIMGDTTMTIKWSESRDKNRAMVATAKPLFEDLTSTAGLSYLHSDYSINDYTQQRLLMQKYSQLGPFITSGDVDKDGSTDFFIGGANFPGRLFTGKGVKYFQSKELSDSTKFEEDEDCVLFDSDNDGDLDLLVTSGGMAYDDTSMYYRPRLYTNDGKGNFSLLAKAMDDSIRTIAGCVSIGDYDKDGDMDVFIGSRVSKSYPLPGRSYLLENDHGVFKDVTARVCPALMRPGMITGAVWIDFDGDKQLDLVIAGEMMPIRFFRNERGRLVDATGNTGLTQINGMWRSLVATDIDNDGDMDLVAGNLGLNCEYGSSTSEPMVLMASDYDGNGSIDPFLFYYIRSKDNEKKLYPALSRGRLAEQVPMLKKKYLSNAVFSKVSFDDLFKKSESDQVLSLHCDETRTCYFENLGHGKFKKYVLPVAAQFSPVNAILCEDFDMDGTKDLLLAGNEYQAEVMTGRYDASYGCFLKGNKNKEFTAVPNRVTGFITAGDVKDMELIQSHEFGKLILVGVNNDSTRVFRVNIPHATMLPSP